MMNRCTVAFFFDEFGVVDEYMFFLLKEMGQFGQRNIFVSNGPIVEEATQRLEAMRYEIIIRDNIGFDVWAYKTALEYIGYDHFSDYDEIILYNHTFYGPIFPFEEMFSAADATDCGFWGITAHKELVPNPFTNEGVLPRHLNSHFIAARRSLAQSDSFKDYWRNMPMIKSYNDSVLTHESRFTRHFEDLGYKCYVYDDDARYSSKYPAFINVDETLENRCPIIKRRIFFHDPLFIEAHGIDLPHALRIMRSTSNYDESLIWKNIVRTATLRTLNSNAALTSVLPDVAVEPVVRATIKRIAFAAHIYYTEMLPEILLLTETIEEPFDFIATTDTEDKAIIIRTFCLGYKNIKKIIVRVMEVNRGRDMASLFITCRDLFLSDKYDLVCRIHSKKSPQVDTARANLFKRHLFENLLYSPGYVSNVISMFETQPWIGLAVPPAVQISYSTLGLGWFANKPKAIETAKELGLKVKMDESTPVAAYGTMFWFRPEALRKLFEREWRWEEFNAEPHHIDGGLAHVLERLIGYTAQDAGYVTQQIMCATQASYNYAMLEFKHQKLASYLPFTFEVQVANLQNWSAAGHVLPPGTPGVQIREGFGFKAAWHEDETITHARGDDIAANLFEKFREQRRQWRAMASVKLGHSIGQSRTKNLIIDRELIMDYMNQVGETTWLRAQNRTLFEIVTEYILFGWSDGSDIFALFDSDFYLNTYPDVASSDIVPFTHYIRFGSKEGRQPHPLFDPIHYQIQAGLPYDHQENLMLHYLRSDLSDLLSPHPLFDAKLYDFWYPEVRELNYHGLIHYLKYGANEKRSPNILFDLPHYERGIGASLPANINPLIHYLEVGSKNEIDPHPLFDIAYYKETTISPIFLEPLTHFYLSPIEEAGHPHPLFDPKDYLLRYPEVTEMDMNPLVHYFRFGCYQAKAPHQYFDGEKYLEAYPEVRSAGLNPLVHYVKYGAAELRPVPDFDSESYNKTIRPPTKGKYIPFVHFLKYGINKL